MKKTILTISTFLLASLPVFTFAASNQDQFVPLVGIPFADTAQITSLGQYANSIYKVAIIVAALLAVLKIIIAGVQYTLSDIVTDKTKARNSIRGAILGLLIVIGAALILQTINPSITNLNALNLQGLQIDLQSQQENTNQSNRDQTCQNVGGNTMADCSVISCQTFDTMSSSQYIGWLGTLLGIIVSPVDYTINRTSCGTRCLFLGGEVTNELSSFSTASGECIYPNNLDQARENLRNASASSTVTTVQNNGGSVEFSMTDFDTSAFQSAQIQHPELRGKTPVGMVNIQTIKNGQYVTDSNGHPISNLDVVGTQVLRQNCTTAGGTTMVAFHPPQYDGVNNEGMLYFCVR